MVEHLGAIVGNQPYEKLGINVFNHTTARVFTARIRQKGSVRYMPVIAKTSISALEIALHDIDISCPFSICIRGK